MRHPFRAGIIMAFCILAGCTENEYVVDKPQNTEPYVHIKSLKYGSDFSFCEVPAGEVTDTVIIISNDSWQISVSDSGSDWISFSETGKTGTSRVYMTVARNTTAQERQATVNVCVPAVDSISFIVSQKAGGSIVSCNYPYDMVFFDAGNEWAHGEYTEERLMKYLVTKDNQWFFDGFAFCCGYFGEGDEENRRYFDVHISERRTDQADWEALIDYYISKTFAVFDTTTEHAIEKTGTRRTTKIILAIPWPAQGQLGWGTIDGESIDFKDNPSKVKACKWFIDTAIRKWREARYENLELVGFYWQHEALGMNTDEMIDAQTVRSVADYIHSYETEFYWCPYFRLAWYSTAKLSDKDKYGFDRVTLQPNYYFRDVDRSRLGEACDIAKANGIGLEFEFDWQSLNSTESLDKAIDYVDVFDEYGVWDSSILSYYHGYRALEDLYDSKNARHIEFYDMLATRISKRQQLFYGFAQN